MKKISLLLLMTGAIHISYAQNTLTMEQIIANALQANFDLAIAANNTTAATNNATKGQAGYLPSVNLNSGANYSINNTNLSFAGGLPDVEVDGAKNISYNASVGFNYLIFNGFGRVHSYQILMNNLKITELQSQVVAENLVLDIVNRYLDIQQNKLNLQAAIDNIAVSEDRLKRVTIGNKNGNKSKLDVLSAEIDLNNDSLSIYTLQTNIAKQMATLNLLMGRDPATKFSLAKDVNVPAQQKSEVIREKALQNNATLLLAQVSEALASNQKSITEGKKLPQIGLTGSYGYNNAQNGAGIVLSQSNLGFSGGINLSMPIFNGNQLQTALKNAELSEKNAALEMQKAKLSVQNQLLAAELDEEFLTQTLTFQEKNLEVANAALQRARLLYSSGNITFNDLRIAQLNVLVAKNSLNQSKINLVKLFYNRARLAGGLLGS
ncbi:TolC family protein [Bacteroidia bacterium]|nr:TolC family protein [Bacteroidia bacterium]MDB4107216.1 TolC family protein [Bacteroidia bacterium]MDB9883362.1 TolC family protein [Bacteroidia bacterium]MDC1395585.1 TolC family protein [Bacteroidia bacterium]